MKTLESPTIERASQLRDQALFHHEVTAGHNFIKDATNIIIARLMLEGTMSSENLVDACKRAFIMPHDDRAFGAVFASLSRAGKIEKSGYCQRRKGHATSGGIIWRLK